MIFHIGVIKYQGFTNNSSNHIVGDLYNCRTSFDPNVFQNLISDYDKELLVGLLHLYLLYVKIIFSLGLTKVYD